LREYGFFYGSEWAKVATNDADDSDDGTEKKNPEIVEKGKYYSR